MEKLLIRFLETKVGKVFKKYPFLLHVVGAYLALVLSDIFFSRRVALIIAIVASVGKELYDKYIQKEKIDVMDLLADAGGICIALIQQHLLFGEPDTF